MANPTRLGLVYTLLFAVTFFNTVSAQNTTADPTTALNTTADPTTESATEGSGMEDETTTTGEPAITTTTKGPCDGYCDKGQECPEGCSCGEGTAKSLNGYCADPCDVEYPWCSVGSVCLQPSNTNTEFVCECETGFYEIESGETEAVECSAGKFFGGSIIFNQIDGEVTNEIIENILDSIYDSTYYVRSQVIEFEEKVTRRRAAGVITAIYELIYQNVLSVTSDTILRSFDESTKGCDGESSVIGNATIDCASKNTTTVANILCENPNPPIDCDDDTAFCNNDDGVSWCSCKDDTNYAKSTPSATSCIKIQCIDNGDCNDPFGTCKDDGDDLEHYCDCMWGFAGEHCREPWEFVFTIVTGALGLILIGVLIACICMNNKSKAANKSAPQEDLNLKNPFIDFQPGIVRAKEVPSNLYSVSDSFNMQSANGGAHSNGAYEKAVDDVHNTSSSFNDNYGRGKSSGAEYF